MRRKRFSFITKNILSLKCRSILLIFDTSSVIVSASKRFSRQTDDGHLPRFRLVSRRNRGCLLIYDIAEIIMVMHLGAISQRAGSFVRARSQLLKNHHHLDDASTDYIVAVTIVSVR